MPVPPPTLQELIATLQRSSLPTVLVEGSDDLIVYRWVEERLGSVRGNILPCGGREMLLQLYSERNKFLHVRTAFVADRDMWFFTNIPAYCAGIIWTTGYCVENDIYDPSPIEALLSNQEKGDFIRCLASIVSWFAFEVEEFTAGRDAHVKAHCLEVVPLGQTSICTLFAAKRNYAKPSDEVVDRISVNYKLAVRGKTLFQLLTRMLSASSRSVKHSYKALIEVALKTTIPNPHLERIIREITAEIIP